MENSVRIALKDVQEVFQGEAERIGQKDERDVVTMVKKMRNEKRAANAGHA